MRTLKLLILVQIIAIQGVLADLPSVNPRPRMESMGGAGAGTLGDRDSAMMNPAGLADIEDGRIEVFPLTIEVPFDVDLFSSFLDFYDVKDSKSSTTQQKQDAFASFLGDAAGASEALRVNFYPSYTRKNWHFGLLLDAYADPKFRVGGLAANQMVELGGSAATVGLILGTGWGFLGDSLQVGVTVKPLYRMSAVVNQTQTAHDVLLGQNKALDSAGDEPSVQNQLFGKDPLDNKGYGVGVDLGVKYKIPYAELLKPSIGFTIQDIGDTRFIGDQDLPRDIPQSVSAGFALQPDWKFFRNTIALDFRNVLKESDLMNKVHLGLESVLWNFFAVRAGLSQGYVTGGVGLMLKIFEMDVYVASREADYYAHTHGVSTLGARLSFGW